MWQNRSLTTGELTSQHECRLVRDMWPTNVWSFIDCLNEVYIVKIIQLYSLVITSG